MEQSQKRKRKQFHMKIRTVLVLAAVWIVCGVLVILPMGSGAYFTLSKPVRLLFGKSESKGIYQGSDHSLFEEIKTADQKNLDKNIEAIKTFADENYNMNVSVMLVPGAANVQSKKLPASAVLEDQSAQFETIRKSLEESVQWVDVEKTLKEHKDEEIYYHTDPHWTSLGAYYGSRVYNEVSGFDDAEAPDLKSYVVNNHFNGALSRESGYEKNYQDSISIYSASNVKDNIQVIVESDGSDEKKATLYDIEKLDTEDGYQLFLGGGEGMTRITTSVNSQKRLLIFKDSYANCMVPFLVPFYHEIVLIDTATYQGDLNDVYQDTKFTDVLFLYGGNNFVTDDTIAGLLEGLSVTTVPESTVDESQEGEEGASDQTGETGESSVDGDSEAATTEDSSDSALENDMGSGYEESSSDSYDEEGTE